MSTTQPIDFSANTRLAHIELTRLTVTEVRLMSPPMADVHFAEIEIVEQIIILEPYTVIVA